MDEKNSVMNTMERLFDCEKDIDAAIDDLAGNKLDKYVDIGKILVSIKQQIVVARSLLIDVAMSHD